MKQFLKKTKQFIMHYWLSIWISVHKEVIGTKLRLLAKKIGGSQNEALGILVRLWLWAMTEADRDGSLKCADKTDIAGVLANGLAENISPDNVVDSLVETEWLEFENGIYYIGLYDSAGDIVCIKTFTKKGKDSDIEMTYTLDDVF